MRKSGSTKSEDAVLEEDNQDPSQEDEVSLDEQQDRLLAIIGLAVAGVVTVFIFGAVYFLGGPGLGAVWYYLASVVVALTWLVTFVWILLRRHAWLEALKEIPPGVPIRDFILALENEIRSFQADNSALAKGISTEKYKIASRAQGDISSALANWNRNLTELQALYESTRAGNLALSKGEQEIALKKIDAEIQRERDFALAEASKASNSVVSGLQLDDRDSRTVAVKEAGENFRHILDMGFSRK